MTENQRQGPTAFQIEVAQLFFSLPAADSFLLAGGAALLAQGLTSRPTQDLDLFTRDAGDVTRARDAFERAADARRRRVETVRQDGDFCRLLVHGPEDLLVDFALSERYDRPTLYRLANDQDAGLVPGVLAEMIGYLDRYSDADLPTDAAQVSTLRRFFAEWAQTLREGAADGTE